MFENDKTYFQRRAEVECERAKRAVLPEVGRVHHQLAQAYLGKLAALDPASMDAS